jgi:hypothetical protein
MSTLSPRFGSHLRLSFLGRFGHPVEVFGERAILIA